MGQNYPQKKRPLSKKTEEVLRQFYCAYTRQKSEQQKRLNNKKGSAAQLGLGSPAQGQPEVDFDGINLTPPDNHALFDLENNFQRERAENFDNF
ncbi:hypothetical protein TNCV_2108691 [Trichonephila clavipes]|nr:hypothetical protein TNCV_2108691 [Trichonephila clavipes]